MAAALEGTRVLDLTIWQQGTSASAMLADLGADVIKIEEPAAGDPGRSIGRIEKAGNLSAYFQALNRGKRSIALDLKHPQGRDVLLRLARDAGVFLTNFRPGVCERLGIGYDEVAKVNPGIIYACASGYGPNGPDAQQGSFDILGQARGGLMSVTGDPDGFPKPAGVSLADQAGGILAAFGILAALLYRERTGNGQYIDMSQWESTMAVLGEGIMDYTMNGRQPPRDGNRDPWIAPHGVFRCAPTQSELPPAMLAEDRWVSIACGSDGEWRALCDIMGQPQLADDPRFRTLANRKANEDELERIVEEWTSTLDPFEATRRLQEAGVAAFPPLMNRELAEDPHLNARGYFVEKEHPEVGVRKHAGIPWRMSETPCQVWRAAPAMGQDNEYVFGEMLGMSSSQIAELVERQVIF